jgi:phosphoribosylanthranilate isomerase
MSPENVHAAIDAVSPWAVDVASGIESAPGVKDRTKLAAFLAAVRG